MNAENRQRNIPLKIQRKKVTEKFDKKRFDFYKGGVESPVSKFFMKILTTAFGTDVESNFVYMNRRKWFKEALYGLGGITFGALNLTSEAKASFDKQKLTGKFDKQDDKIELVDDSYEAVSQRVDAVVNSEGAFFEGGDGGEPTPKTEPQKKVYNYFWNKKEWTYAKMDALKPLEVKSYLAKAGVDITNTDDLKDAYFFFKRLKHAQHGKESLKEFESTLGSRD